MRFRAGGKWYNIKVEEHEDYYIFHTQYVAKDVREEIKKLQNRKWLGGKPPTWEGISGYKVPKTPRNIFTIKYLLGTENPYEPYRRPLCDPFLEPRYNKKHRKVLTPFAHQQEMARHWWTRGYAHIGAEMRTGKTLPALSILERLGCISSCWWVGPKSALAGVELECYIWEFEKPILMTYEKMVKLLTEWGTSDPPQAVVFDESSRIKTPNTQRTLAAMHLVQGIKDSHAEGMALAMTGTPAPKAPTDYWAQIETICPGYIAESNIYQLLDRLAITKEYSNPTGGKYKTIETWLDNERKCAYCGKLDTEHSQDTLPDHKYTPSVNEVTSFAKRLRGISLSIRKADVLDLPPMDVERIYFKPSEEVLRCYQTIQTMATSTISGLTLARQLSGGFMYVQEKGGEIKCPRCKGTGEVISYGAETQLLIDQSLADQIVHGKEQVILPKKGSNQTHDPIITICPKCNGEKYIPNSVRVAHEVDCPKDQKLQELLEEYEESGRFVVYAGFQGEIDKISRIVSTAGWEVIQVDGRGWLHKYKNNTEALKDFGKVDQDYSEKVCWVAHPESGGMGISLSSSKVIVFWSNSFKAEDRLQAIERCTDSNMDLGQGCKVFDFIHLPTDEWVLENLGKKKDLQNITMDQIKWQL